MQISDIVPQKKHKNRLSVYVDGEFSFGIDEFDALKLKLKIGKSITNEEIAEIKETVLLSRAKEYALSLCSARFYTQSAIVRKMKEKEFDDWTISETLSFLKEYKFIDDFEYARKFTQECIDNQKGGRIKIKMLLREKGISAEIIDEVLGFYDFDEYEKECLLKLARKKLCGNFEYKNIMKVKRYFISKGFSFDAVDRAIKEISEKKSLKFDFLVINILKLLNKLLQFVLRCGKITLSLQKILLRRHV